MFDKLTTEDLTTESDIYNDAKEFAEWEERQEDRAWLEAWRVFRESLHPKSQIRDVCMNSISEDVVK
mgnify:CR=1 FL=1